MKKVIDVSHHQGTINWEKVKAAGIFGAIIRVSDSTGTMDRQCDRNIAECKRLGIPFGLYIYSRATTEDRAQKEAQICLDKAKGCILSFPIYIDLEQEGTENYAKTAAKIFGDIIEAAGYKFGVYANQYWWSTCLSGMDKYTKWVARYSTTPPAVKNYDMWQYSSTGTVDGISGNVDLNEFYGEISTATTEETGESLSYTGNSIVDYLVSIGIDSSMENRKKLAAQYGISNYTGTAAQNLELLSKMRGSSASSQATEVKQETPSTDKPTYVVGKTYTLQTNLQVRDGAGTNYRAKTHSELTADGQKHDKDKNGSLDKGTVITCKEIKTVGNDIWIKSPSGWLAGYYNGNVYIK